MSVLNHWKIFETTLKTESIEQNQTTYLQRQLFHTIQDLISLISSYLYLLLLVFDARVYKPIEILTNFLS